MVRDCLGVLAVVEGTGPRRCGRESCLLKMKMTEEEDWGKLCWNLYCNGGVHIREQRSRVMTQGTGAG